MSLRVYSLSDGTRGEIYLPPLWKRGSEVHRHAEWASLLSKVYFLHRYEGS